jgi:hypothetical protein
MRNVRVLAILLALSAATGSVTSLAGERAAEPRASEALRERQHRLDEFRQLWPDLSDAQIQARLDEIRRAFEPERSPPVPPERTPSLSDLSKSALEDKDVPVRLNTDDVPRLPHQLVARPLRLEYVVSNNSTEYVLTSPFGNVLYQGVDQTKLAAVLNERLSSSLDLPLHVQMKGFSEDKFAALITTLRIRQRTIDRSVSIQDLSANGIRLQRASLAMDTNTDGSMYRADLTFIGRLGDRIRTVSIRVVSATFDVVLDFLIRVHQILYSPDFDEKQTLRELIDRARRELKSNHKGLTDEQLKVEMIDQFGNITIVERLLSTAFVWS